MIRPEDAALNIASWLAQRAAEAIVARAVKRVERRVGDAVRTRLPQIGARRP